MKCNKQRKAFSMLTAIVVIVLMASVGAFVMNLSGKIVKTTTTQFQREQAMLLAKSYTEFAIMSVMSNDVTTNCLQTIQSNNVIRAENQGGFDVTVQIAYIGNGNGRITPCDGVRQLSDAAITNESPLNVLVDVYVKYQDVDGLIPNTSWITYHKRTLQKI
jgi:type II secretory pathway pseudopilin PulG